MARLGGFEADFLAGEGFGTIFLALAELLLDLEDLGSGSGEGSLIGVLGTAGVFLGLPGVLFGREAGSGEVLGSAEVVGSGEVLGSGSFETPCLAGVLLVLLVTGSSFVDETASVKNLVLSLVAPAGGSITAGGAGGGTTRVLLTCLALVAARCTGRSSVVESSGLGGLRVVVSRSESSACSVVDSKSSVMSDVWRMSRAMVGGGLTAGGLRPAGRLVIV